MDVDGGTRGREEVRERGADDVEVRSAEVMEEDGEGDDGDEAMDVRLTLALVAAEGEAAEAVDVVDVDAGAEDSTEVGMDEDRGSGETPLVTGDGVTTDDALDSEVDPADEDAMGICGGCAMS